MFRLASRSKIIQLVCCRDEEKPRQKNRCQVVGTPADVKEAKLKSALRVNPRERLQALSPSDLSRIGHELRNILYWWIGDPTVKGIQDIRASIPLLDDLLDFSMVLKRPQNLETSSEGNLGTSLDSFLPELRVIYKAAVEIIHSKPNGVSKAENWLLPIAEEAGADSDLEAAVYFASRGKKEAIDVDRLRTSWYRSVCSDIERKAVGKMPATVVARAKAGTLSLSEAASLLEFNGRLFRFASFRDEEEDFIDAAVFRAVEWLGISGFEPWVRSMVSDLSEGPRGGIDHTHASWWLFFWCRSDLALRMADRNGLQAWLWALLNGPIERGRPWRTFFSPPGRSAQYRDYLPLAGALAFIWQRIAPTMMTDDVVNSACELLYQTQLQSGGWPLYADDSEPCLIGTCFAIHGLATRRPTGWKDSVAKAAQWLKSEQNPGGDWDISGGPTVMLTVLALDALSLAEDAKTVTFKLAAQNQDLTEPTSSLDETESVLMVDRPTYDYSKESWFKPSSPKISSISFTAAKSKWKPTIALVVATDVELRQVLRVLRPPKKQLKVVRVTHKHDVYYVGRFGSFTTAVTLSGMGSQGVAGATLSVEALIRYWGPDAVVLVGIAFGAYPAKHLPGDVLVSEHLIPYERQKVAGKAVFRSARPSASAALLNRFRNAIDWSFLRPDGEPCRMHIGALLSGEKVVNDPRFKAELLREFPEAVGGEMEGTGLWSAADREKTHWIVVKGVCDWADGKKNDGYQEMAAASAVSLCACVLNDRYALAGL
jgi:nucleoside phosphorylase